MNANFQDYGVIKANVKWYDRYNRQFSKNFHSVESARNFYKELCSNNEQSLFVRWVVETIEGTIVLGEHRSS